MIFWNYGRDVVDLGPAPSGHCDTCDQERPFKILLRYRYWALYWIFGLVTSKEYFQVCEVCGRADPLHPVEVEGRSSRAIPFTRRLGWLLLVAIIAFFALFGWITHL
jgi:hypothetical protein